MSHTYVKNHFHLVFSTKDRQKLIPKKFNLNSGSYMAGICRNHDLVPIAINGTDNHCHVLFHLPPTILLSKAISVIKANSSRWMKQHKRDFAWQVGGGAFAVSVSDTPTVVRYIQNQEAHHRKRRYEDEYLALLKKHGVDYDPRYVFG